MDLRPATLDDAAACLAVQRRAAVVGYAHIFPQDEYPFPDDVVGAEWRARLTDGTHVQLAVVGDEVVGTVGARAPWVLALFVVPEQWGSGVGHALHEAVLAHLAAHGCATAQLDVLVDNARARRFYERRGWAWDGRTDVSPFPPYPELLGYARDLTDIRAAAAG